MLSTIAFPLPLPVSLTADRVRTWLRACEKVNSDVGLGAGSCRFEPVTKYHMAEKIMINQNLKYPHCRWVLRNVF